MTGLLVNHLWQSTLFALLAAVLALLLRHNRAHVRYWLWFSASLKFLLPFSLLMSVGSYLGPIRPANTAHASSMSVALVQITEPFPENAPRARLTARTTGWKASTAALIWACGFAAIAVVRVRGWIRIRRAVRSSTAIDVPAYVEVRSSPGLLEPGVVGLLRPILLLPVGITERLTPAQFRAVLAHELCHIRRHDNLLASIHMLVEAVFWFHPAVWWIGARLVEERERACDQDVLSLGSAPEVYAQAIVRVCRFYAESPLGCVSGVTGSNIHKRIESIMANRIVARVSTAKKAALAFAGIAVFAIPIAAGLAGSPRLRAQSDSPRVAKFESVSITPCADHPGLKRGAGYSIAPGRMKTGCMSLADENNLGLIQRAYVRFAGGRAHPLGVIPIDGGPAWVRSDLYDIDARTSGTPPQEVMQGPMLQALLEERFSLKVHRESREVPVYALTIDVGGHRLHSFTDGSCLPMPLVVPFPSLAPGQRYCRLLAGVRPPGVSAEGATLADFSHLLSLVLDRPVVDRTGIEGKFDIHLQFAIEAATRRVVPGGDISSFASDPGVPSIFTAIRQLGLKLEAVNGSREFLVIDHVERPAEY